jgi:hypothetical protein
MTCHIYPVAATGGAFHWKWRSDDGKRKSSRAFELFYDCVEDARSHGARVNLERAHEEIASATLNVKIVADDAARFEAATTKSGAS